MSDNGEKNEWMNGRWWREEKKNINFEMQVSVMTEDNELKAIRKRNQTMRFLLFGVCLWCECVREIRTLIRQNRTNEINQCNKRNNLC